MGLTLRLDSLTRVYQIWFAVFCLRSWRYSMSCESVFPLSKHFLMLNAHKCAKINAHGVVMLLVRLSKGGTPNLFKPWLMSSQPCVYYFKCACSFTSVGITQLIFKWFNFLWGGRNSVSGCTRFRIEAWFYPILASFYWFCSHDSRLILVDFCFNCMIPAASE